MLKKSNLKNEKGLSKAVLEDGTTKIQWLVATLANTTLISYGLQSGWVSPMTKILQSEQSPSGLPLSDNEMSWIASTLCLSAALGVPLYAFITDRFGRKAGVIAIAVPQGLAWLLKLSSGNTAVIVAARAFCGLAAGGCFNVIPIYVKEISQDSNRGLLGSLMILSQNIGVLAMYALGAYLDYFSVLYAVAWLPAVTILLMMKAPESPSFLVKTGRTDEATQVIAQLIGLDVDHKIVQNQICSLRNEELYFKSLPNVSCLAIMKDKAWRRGFVGVLSIITISALNGCFAIVTYASHILSHSGATFNSEVLSLSFPPVMILSGFISMMCVERYGRKTILIFTLLLIMVAMTILASIILVQHQGGSVVTWLPVLCMMVAVGGYSGGVAPMPYIMMSEMFNFQIRAKVMGIIVTLGWFLTFIPLYIYAPICNAFGMYTMFYCYAMVNLVGIYVVLVLLPETKGKSVQEIETELRTK